MKDDDCIQLLTFDALDGRVCAILVAAMSLESSLAKVPIDHRDALLTEFRNLFENVTENEDLAIRTVMTRLRRIHDAGS